MKLQLLLQIPNALGVLSMIVTGRKRRIGWVIGIVQEVAWAGWAYFAHDPGIYPWCVAWSAVFVRNWWKWR